MSDKIILKPENAAVLEACTDIASFVLAQKDILKRQKEATERLLEDFNGSEESRKWYEGYARGHEDGIKMLQEILDEYS